MSAESNCQGAYYNMPWQSDYGTSHNYLTIELRAENGGSIIDKQN